MNSKNKKLKAAFVISILLFLVNASAETTFFDQDDAFILGNSMMIGSSMAGGMTGGTVELAATEAGCSYNWNCTDWSECLSSGKQTRECINIGTCAGSYKSPEISQDCNSFSSQKALFDIALTIINPEIIIGDNLTALISLVNFGNKTNLNVTLNYTITNWEDKIILTEKEIVPVEIHFEFLKELVLPYQVELGKYKLIVEIYYEGQESGAVSQGPFEIISDEKGFFPFLTGRSIWTESGELDYLVIGVSLSAVIVLVMIFYILMKFVLFNRSGEEAKIRAMLK